jgi:putative FmdB family regulatory protein
MPLYEYECGACGKRFELIRKFSDLPVEVCSLCGRGPVQRLPSSPAIQFKGSGFYITDYAQKGKSDKSETSTADKSGEGKSDTTAKGEGAAKSDAAAKPTDSSTTKQTKESKE